MTPAPEDSPGTAAWRAIEPYWNSVEIHESVTRFLDDFRRIPRHVGHLLAVHWCQSEICNGGFDQFFRNSTGVLAPEAVDGFRAIGSEPLGDLVANAMAILGELYPRDRSTRLARLAAARLPGIKRKDWDPFNTMDEQFYGLIEEYGFWQAADQYARTAAG